MTQAAQSSVGSADFVAGDSDLGDSVAGADFASFAATFSRIVDNVASVVQGKQPVIALVVNALIAGGHVLVEDVPGVGKTTLAKALARSVDMSFGRIQFTPDLLPADVTGTSIYNRASGTFEFRPGPVFSNVVLADEINRASPKTQSALLEAMGEAQVTVDGHTHALGLPFTVIATQNPLEHEGTYPLPDSQLDRFFMRLTVGYPDRAAEDEVLRTRQSAEPVESLRPVAAAAELREISQQIDHVHMAPALRQYLLDIADATRNHPGLGVGLSPRGVLSLARAGRVRAASMGRGYVTPDDVKALVPVVVPHRLPVTHESRMRGASSAALVAEIMNSVAVPRGD